MKSLPIFIDKDGRWYHEGIEITHERLYLYLNECLTISEEEGYFLKSGDNIYKIEVEDTPFVVKKIRCEGENFILTLNDNKEENLDINTLEFKNNIPYCKVKNGKFLARFLRNSYFQLAEHIVESEDGYYLSINGNRHKLE
jgi:hypothetical protein